MGRYEPRWLGGWQALGLAGGTVACFHIAYFFPAFSFLIAVAWGGLFELTRIRGARQAFYGGIALGLAIYVPHLAFFWTIFKAAALVLWLVPSIWVGLYMLVGRGLRKRWSGATAALLIPCIWTGIEYFRSELYPLRFTWLNAATPLSGTGAMRVLPWVGVYGIGWVLMMGAGGVSLLWPRWRAVASLAVVALLAILVHWPLPAASSAGATFHLTGVQMEFPSTHRVIVELDRALAAHPETDLFMLSEYTFGEPVPAEVRAWCAKHRKHLVAGGKDPISPEGFYNTAFVVGPDGSIVFRQAKCIPIQFMRDGSPAREQRVWESPWGKVGICICYDLSYRRVTDGLIRQGAQCLLVPTMDVEEWGAAEHALHGRMGPLRAAEYGIPVVRVCSSGISQFVDGRGRLGQTGVFPGEDVIVAGEVRMGGNGHAPGDRVLGVACAAIAGLALLMLLARRTLLR